MEDVGASRDTKPSRQIRSQQKVLPRDNNAFRRVAEAGLPCTTVFVTTRKILKSGLGQLEPGSPDTPDSHRGPRTEITRKGCYEWCYDAFWPTGNRVLLIHLTATGDFEQRSQRKRAMNGAILNINLCSMFILVPGSSRAGLDRHSVSNFARLAMA